MKTKTASALVAAMVLSVPSGLIAAECVPVFKPITEHRQLPHSYVDQGLESIPTIYPKHKLLLQRRYAMVGRVEYSLLVFQEDSAIDSVTIEGAVVRHPQAWTFQVKCSKETILECLVVTLEKIAAQGQEKPTQ